MIRWKKLLVFMFCFALVSVQVNADTLQNKKASKQYFTQLLKEIDSENRVQNMSYTEPEKAITREEAAVMLVTVLGFEGIAKDYKNSTKFKDVSSHQGEIHIVTDLGIMNPPQSNLFMPQDTLTESEGQTIVNRVLEKLSAKPKWSHAFYAISSNSQMNLIKNFDAVSFGWAQIEYDKQMEGFILSREGAQNNFKVPSGFEIPLDEARANQVEAYLMIFFGNQGSSANKLFLDSQKRDEMIQQICALCKGITKDGETRDFDGVTIDFENFYSAEIKQPYVDFLRKLKGELEKDNKKLNVAVQPSLYFKGYDYKGIGEVADKVILMAHDYAPKELSATEMATNSVMTPVTPINEIYRALKEITSPVSGVQDKNKVVLQISIASTQWQSKNGKVINSKPYTPSYDKIYERLLHNNTQDLYSELYQNPYALYEQDGITNTIWYENAKSVNAKVNLAKLTGIYSVSYWRLGILPDFVK